MEEIFCMEWNMEEIFRYGMEDGMEKNCRYGIWKNRLPFHSITCPDCNIASHVFTVSHCIRPSFFSFQAVIGLLSRLESKLDVHLKSEQSGRFPNLKKSKCP